MNGQPVTARRMAARLGERAGAAGSGTLTRPSAFDIAIAVAGGIAVAIEALIRDKAGVSPLAYLLVPVSAGPLAFRTVAPLGTLVAVAVGAVLSAVLLGASWAMTAVVAVALFTVVLLGHRRRSLAVGVATAVAVVVIVLAIDETVDAGAMVSRVAIVVLCVAAGEVLRTRQELSVARREHAAQEERERAEQLRRAAAAERVAITRELHDSLGHFLVAINVRASVAIEVPESQDPAAALRDIKKVSADALRDLRSTLSAIRDGDELAPTAPAAGLDALTHLVEAARAAGVETALQVDVDPDIVPAATSAATVRIVQESLTNVLKHARATHASVSVQAGAGVLAVEIVDDGTAPAGASVPGFGVRGMSERASALGGRLDAGPCAVGGWSVNAQLPLPNEGDR